MIPKHLPGPPMDLANMRAQGVHHLIAFCLNDACRHQALIDVSTGIRANPVGLSKVPEAENRRRLPMRSLYVVGLLAGIVFTVVASTRPGVAAVIYPWCANYGGAGRGGYGASSCGSTSFKECLATLSGNGGNCSPNPWYQPYPPPTTYAPPIRR